MISKKLLLSLSLLTAFPINAVKSDQTPTTETIRSIQPEFQPIIQPRPVSRWENFVYATERNAGKIIFGIPATFGATAGIAALIKGSSFKDAASIASAVAGASLSLSFWTYFGITESLD